VTSAEVPVEGSEGVVTLAEVPVEGSEGVVTSAEVPVEGSEGVVTSAEVPVEGSLTGNIVIYKNNLFYITVIFVLLKTQY